MIRTRTSRYPAAPSELPREGPCSRLLRMMLPTIFRPSWKLEELFACKLHAYGEVPIRDDVQVCWIYRLKDLRPEHKALLTGHLGQLGWAMWEWRLIRRFSCVALARWRGQTVHYAFVSYGGGVMKPYAKAMFDNSAIVGPCYTAPQARGNGIYPYVVAWALARLKASGRRWAYIHTSCTNKASLKGIRKIPAWIHVGRFLLRRPAFRRYRIEAATIVDPSAIPPSSC